MIFTLSLLRTCILCIVEVCNVTVYKVKNCLESYGKVFYKKLKIYFAVLVE